MAPQSFLGLLCRRVLCQALYRPPFPYSVDDNAAITSDVSRRLLMECHEIMRAACELAHARCAKILSIRAKVSCLTTTRHWQQYHMYTHTHTHTYTHTHTHTNIHTHTHTNIHTHTHTHAHTHTHTHTHIHRLAYWRTWSPLNLCLW